MAKIIGPFKFVGTISDVNAYQIPGSEEVIARAKPGPTAQQIKNDPSFERTRENNKDFGAGSVFSKEIRQASSGIHNLTYSHIASQLTGLGKRFTKLIDTGCDRGKRPVLISKAHQWLTDYDLNKKCLFNTVYRTRMPFAIDRDNASATIHIPELLPGIQFVPPASYPFYKLRFVLGAVTDIIWTPEGHIPAVEENRKLHEFAETEWRATGKKHLADDLSIQLQPDAPLADCQSLILFAGIEWGVPDDINMIKPVKRKGCAKILGLA